mgnify:CR=1 FL=1
MLEVLLEVVRGGQTDRRPIVAKRPAPDRETADNLASEPNTRMSVRLVGRFPDRGALGLRPAERRSFMESVKPAGSPGSRCVTVWVDMPTGPGWAINLLQGGPATGGLIGWP